MAKTKKSVKKSTKKTKAPNPFEAGLKAEQVLAESLCDQFLREDGDDGDAIDEAFVAAFRGLAYRMLSIFNEDFVNELLTETAALVNGDHVCEHCQAEAEENGESLPAETRNKMH